MNSGTSHAAPHITGAVARYLGKNPTATADEVTQALLKATDKDVKNTPQSTTDQSLDVESLLQSQDSEKAQEQEEEDRFSYWRYGSQDYSYRDNDDYDDDDDD